MNYKQLRLKLIAVTLCFIGAYSVYGTYRSLRNDEIANQTVNSTTTDTVTDTDYNESLEEALMNKEKEKIAKDKGNLSEKFQQAYSINNEATGWIYIYGTNIDYPIMHGENNYYLNRSYDRKRSRSGSIFLEEMQLGFDNISLIHGHNMLNGVMFSQLMKYRKADFYNEHKTIYIYDGTKERKFEIISVFNATASISFKLRVEGKQALKSYAQELANKNMHNIIKTNDNDIIILNTCMSDGSDKHLIVVGQEVHE